ncbi:uncharacterized protein [Chironomus tepperi]|uniref:uncharacterized protein n=1 Tax=Chironomus tepperi TaxID=113505 RepID=UPI00391F6347
MDALNFAKEVPTWLNQELFDKAIRSYQSDPQAKVTSFDIKAATKPGENFASAVFRAAIKFTSKYSKDEKEMSVIIKTQPVNVDLPGMDHMRDTTLFETEIAVYTKVLDKIQELITSVGYNDIMCPKLIYETMTPKPVIILEDVSSNGFDTMIHTMHEDFEVSKMIVKRLAKHHAAGFYLQDENKIDATPFDTCIFKFENMVEMMFADSFELLTEEMSKWGGYERYIEAIQKFKTCFLEKALKTYSPNTGPGAFNVLNHGDFHYKNMLYKMNKDDGKVEDILMLDFQICVYASPAIDLTYTLHNFVSDENRYTRYDELLATYHEQFVEALKRFGYLKQPPSLLDLQVEMLKNGNLQAQNGLFMFPFLIFDMSTLTPEDFTGGSTTFKTRAYQNERFKKVLQDDLPRFLNKGFIPIPMDAYHWGKTISPWLDQDLFDKAIQSYVSDPKAKVTSFDIKAATKPGENFASAVYRAAIKFTSKYSKDEKEMSVIIKTQPVNVDLPDMEILQDTTLYDTEIAAYTEVLVKIQELVSGAGYEDVMCPKLIYYTMTPKPVIMLEDVKVNGFDTMIPSIHEDFEISKMIVKRLAKFHAAGYYLQDEKKIDATTFDSCIFKLGKNSEKMFGDGYEALLSTMSSWDGFEKYLKPIEKFKEVALKKALKTYLPSSSPNAINVLNHGDFHFKNMLYKISKDDGKIEDFMMLDFQICVYGSPAIDLIYTLYNFVSDEDRITRYDEFLYIYHEQFIEALTKFGYLKQPPSLLDLQVEMMKNGHLRVHNGLLLYPFIIFDLSTLIPEDMAGGMKDLRCKIFRNERYKRVIRNELEMFLHKGYLTDNKTDLTQF